MPVPTLVLDLAALAGRDAAEGLARAAGALWPVVRRPGARLLLVGEGALTAVFQRALLRRYPLAMIQALRLERAAAVAPGLRALAPAAVAAGTAASGLRDWLAQDHPLPAPAVLRDSPRWAEARPALSVVVPTFSRFDCLGRLLGALAAQEGAPPFEVIVVDDGSPAGPAAWPVVADSPLALRMLRQPNQGPAAARNTALDHVRGRLLVLLNDDAVPPPGLLAAHARAWEDGPQDAVLMGVFTLIPERRRDSFAEVVETTNLLFPQPTLPGPGPFPGMVLCTGNCSLPTAWLRAVGGFDTWFTQAGGEDTELGRRLQLALGHRVRFDAALACGHDHELSVAGFVRRQEHLGRSVVYLARRWGDPRIVTGDAAVPLDAAYRASQERLVAQGARALATLPGRLDARCAAERQAGRLAGELPAFAAMVRRVGALAFARGVVGALRG